ncbi:hypothetical protein L6452_30481 [Arctium lappa]|uniref:Uncharacterized protein n=1 Tax=Arctium lappa TaxID=4217 RepID=A0ACB8ZJG9_ARCLA|nr:hypothetical protein L6452_30481 [Arctium lappa]
MFLHSKISRYWHWLASHMRGNTKKTMQGNDKSNARGKRRTDEDNERRSDVAGGMGEGMTSDGDAPKMFLGRRVGESRAGIVLFLFD